jgi:hypothetical protein
MHAGHADAAAGSVCPPAAAFTCVLQLSAVSSAFVRRLQLLEEVNMLMPAMQRSEAVAGYFR